jgi:cephalosporin hydroxylase
MRTFNGLEYLVSLRSHYGQLLKNGGLATLDERLHIGFVRHWAANIELVGVDSPQRFQAIAERAFAMKQNVWITSFDRGPEGLRRVGASSSYKGLIHFKPPCDLVLYTNLIWELAPATIIEFGALQGGSSLWFADQLETLCQIGSVHSFELLDRCIHPNAAHPRLQFHQADLNDLMTLDRNLFLTLPHPWLVIDDAHANVIGLLRFMSELMQAGDYYVIEDALLRATPGQIGELVELCNSATLMVDSKYSDAFGYNVTCAPNGWLRKG